MTTSGRSEMEVDGLIKCMLTMTDGSNLSRMVPESEIAQLCLLAQKELLSQGAFLELQTPIKVVGDIHGQYEDLLRILHKGGFPPQTSYLFLGDYVDRGMQSIEVAILLLAFKVKYPTKIHLLRGNHECASINQVYGFYQECTRRYSVALWKNFQQCFDCLPFAALIDNKIFCAHGGLSPDLNDWSQLKNIKAPIEAPKSGLLNDLLWSDPDRWVKGFVASIRGVSFMYGADVVHKFCNAMDVDLVVRGHQVIPDGFEFFANQHLVTLFSATNFCGEFDNSGAMMNVDKDLLCTFDVIRPAQGPKAPKT